MRKRLIYEATLLCLIFGSIWGVFSIFPVWPEKRPSGLSAEKEKKLGNLLLKATLTDPALSRVENDTINAVFDILEKRLTSALEPAKYDYEIILLESDMANAFALPGGYILVTDQLLGILDSPEELASVLAHEIGHIEKRHTITKLLANFTAAVLFGDNALAAEAAEMLATSAYSRRQEEIADDFALILLEKSGINPHIMGTAFRHLKEDADYHDINMEIIMSHPDIDSRIKKAYDYTVAEGFREKELDIDWSSVKNQVSPQISQ